MLERLKRLPLVSRVLSRPVLALALAIVVVGAVIAGVAISKEADIGGTEGPRPTAQWTTVHYVSMDNNLDAWGEWQADLHSLEEVGSSPESHHIAIYDGDEDGDTILQYVVEGGVEERPVTDVDPEWPAEVNLGDPQVLSTFIVWAATEYPAENLCLVLNNHGGGWFGICWDDTDEDFLTPAEVADALEAVEHALGRKVDVVLCYACLMASTEFAYEICDHADYLVGSETYSWGSETHDDGYLIGNYPFDRIWGPLKDDPSMSPRDFACHVVDAFQIYGPYVSSTLWFHSTDYSSDTVAAIDLSKIPALVTAVDQMGRELESSLTGLGKVMSHTQLVNRVIGSPEMPPEYCTQSFSGQPDWIGQATFVDYDLLDLVSQLEKCDVHQLVDDSTLQAIREAHADAVIAEKHGTDPDQGHHVDATGLSIWLPFRTEEYRTSYETRAFALDTSWDEFLRALIVL